MPRPGGGRAKKPDLTSDNIKINKERLASALDAKMSYYVYDLGGWSVQLWICNNLNVVQ